MSRTPGSVGKSELDDPAFPRQAARLVTPIFRARQSRRGCARTAHRAHRRIDAVEYGDNARDPMRHARSKRPPAAATCSERLRIHRCVRRPGRDDRDLDASRSGSAAGTSVTIRSGLVAVFSTSVLPIRSARRYSISVGP